LVAEHDSTVALTYEVRGVSAAGRRCRGVGERV